MLYWVITFFINNFVLEINVNVNLLLEMNRNANQSSSDLLLSLEGEIFCNIEIRSHSQSQLLKWNFSPSSIRNAS